MRTAEMLHYQRFAAIAHILPVSPDYVTALVRSRFFVSFSYIDVCIVEYPTKPVYIFFDIRTIYFTCI